MTMMGTTKLLQVFFKCFHHIYLDYRKNKSKNGDEEAQEDKHLELQVRIVFVKRRLGATNHHLRTRLRKLDTIEVVSPFCDAMLDL